MEEHSTPRLCFLFLGILHICPLFLLPLPIFPFEAWQVLPWMETLSDAEGYSCLHGQDSGGWTENMGGTQLPFAPWSEMDKTHSRVKDSHPLAPPPHPSTHTPRGFSQAL